MTGMSPVVLPPELTALIEAVPIGDSMKRVIVRRGPMMATVGLSSPKGRHPQSIGGLLGKGIIRSKNQSTRSHHHLQGDPICHELTLVSMLVY